MGAISILYHPFQVGIVSFKPLCSLTCQLMKNNIRVERAKKDITQAELAGLVSVSRQTINTIESNRYVPSTVLAMKIARVFGKPVEEVFILDEGD